MDAARLDDLRTRERSEDLPLIIDLARRGGPNILELGCGTGRVLRALVTAGFRPIGIDASADAVRVAKCNSPDLRVECQRMETFNLGLQFDLILIPFGSFEHLISLDDRLATLRRVLDHSHAETLLYIDIWPLDLSPDTWLQEQPARLLKPIRTDSTEIEVHFSATREPARRRSRGRFLYREHLADGTAREVSSVFTVSPMTDDELRLCLHVSGFRIEGWWGDYQRTPYDPVSHCRLLATARPALLKRGQHRR
jgi:SAM-dependent methyltransferase